MQLATSWRIAQGTHVAASPPLGSGLEPVPEKARDPVAPHVDSNYRRLHRFGLAEARESFVEYPLAPSLRDIHLLHYTNHRRVYQGAATAAYYGSRLIPQNYQRYGVQWHSDRLLSTCMAE